MVPDKFNMVDMGGIDLIMMQGEDVPGLYEKLMAAISNCQYQCLYNWLFDGVLIPPTYVQLEDVDGEVYLNEGVSVTSDDVIHIYSIEPPAPEPEIIPLLAEENGVYNVPSGKDGFNPVTVDVPSYTPIIESLSITENGTYTASAGVDGYSPITVNVSSVGTSDKLRPISILNSSNILCEYDGLNLMPSNSNMLYGSVTEIPGFHLFPVGNNSKLGFDLGEANHSTTAYVIGKMLNGGGNYQIIGMGYANSSGNAPNFFSNGNYFYSSVYGSDISTGKPYDKFVLFTLSVNSVTKKARFYADGVFLTETSFTNSGRYVSFGCGLLNDGSIANMRETSLLYMAVVDGVEADETILANHVLLLQEYANYIGT